MIYHSDDGKAYILVCSKCGEEYTLWIGGCTLCGNVGSKSIEVENYEDEDYDNGEEDL